MDERACRTVGIDLGTTYSSLAYMDAQLTPRVVADSQGQAVVPSVIFFEDEEIIVGDVALQNSKLRPDRVVQFVKVHMGDPWSREILGKTHTPESLSAMILAHLVREAEPQIGPIPSAVITVPAFFTEKRRRATQQAGEIAGLQVIGTLNEPMAAALAYGLHRQPKEQTALVFDLGGGTFDVTIVRVTPSDLEELVTYGNRQLGGKDWDQCLIDHVIDDFGKKHGLDPRDALESMQALQLQCEQAKRQLSKRAKTTISLSAHGIEHHVEVTREQFEGLTAHLLAMTKLTAEMALEDAGLKWSNIARVVLVGGSTHMPMVRAMLSQLSGAPPDTGVNPVIAVALGAAIYAHMLEAGAAGAVRQKVLEPKTAQPAPVQVPEPAAPEPVASVPAASEPAAPEPVASVPAAPEPMAHEPVVSEPAAPPVAAPPKVHFVTAHGVGVKAMKHGELRNVLLIPRNRRVPVREVRRFRTRKQGGNARAVRIVVTQGDAPDIELVEVLGILQVEGLPPGEPEGQPVDVTMAFDEQGRLHIHAVYVMSGQDLEISLHVPGGLEQEQVDEYRQYLQAAGLVADNKSPGQAPAGRVP